MVNETGGEHTVTVPPELLLLSTVVFPVGPVLAHESRQLGEHSLRWCRVSGLDLPQPGTFHLRFERYRFDARRRFQSLPDLGHAPHWGFQP